MLSKVAAGGLAAAVAAVAGSYFGPLGTVGAAAAASVVTAVSSEVFQRSIDRTAGALRPGKSADAAPGGPRSGRRGSLVGALVVAVLVFGVGMAAVTGIEKATDEPLSGGGERTTTLGRLTDLDVGSGVGGLLGGRGGSKGPEDSGNSDNTESSEKSQDSADSGGSKKDGLLGDLLG